MQKYCTEVTKECKARDLNSKARKCLSKMTTRQQATTRHAQGRSRAQTSIVSPGVNVRIKQCVRCLLQWVPRIGWCVCKQEQRGCASSVYRQTGEVKLPQILCVQPRDVETPEQSGP